MSPRSQSSPGTFQASAGASDHEQNRSITTNPDEDSASEQEEARPPHTAEIGTLKKLSVSGGTAWLGSSSGVYFVNTVRRAFSAAFAATSPDHDGTMVPASEDIITGEDAAGQNFNGSNSNHRIGHYEPDFFRHLISSVGRPPADRRLAMDLVTTFFRQTHPLFPFLHGPRFLEDMNEIYTALNQSPASTPKSPVVKQGNKSLLGANSIRRSSPNRQNSTTSSSDHTLGTLSSIDLLKLITFQIIINIAALSHTNKNANSNSSGHPLPPSSMISSAHNLLTLILPLSTTPLLPTIQLLLAAELYLLSTISLRHSSTLAGLVLRLIYHAGLHRCPLRYASLTPQDCEIRKRIFWSAYALDRHLSLALGDPNTFQDSDIDVCLSRSGEGELHRAVARELLGDGERGEEWRMHFPRDARGNIVFGDTGENKQQHQQQQQKKEKSGGDVTMADASNMEPLPAKPTAQAKDKGTMMDDDPRTNSALSTRTQQLREAALTAYVQYGKLTGRIIEIFHKSINFRFPKQDAIGYLTADIENWWNDLPSTLTGDFTHHPSSHPPTTATTRGNGSSDMDMNVEDVDPGLVEQHKLLTPFFTLLYHQLLLLLNRPRLSLDQATAEFQQGLQVCIRASRNTLSALKKHKENEQSMFLPGLLSAAWMSGLIIAFACQLGKYPKQRACGDIRSCLLLLESMNVKWYTVKNCHKVLSLLLANITSRKANSSGYLSASRNEFSLSTGAINSNQAITGGIGVIGPTLHHTTRKRARESVSMNNNNTNDTGSEAEPSPKRDSSSIAGSVSSPGNSDFRLAGNSSGSGYFQSPDIRPTMGNTSNPSTRQRENSTSTSNNNNNNLSDFSTANMLSRQDSVFSASDFDFSSANIGVPGTAVHGGGGGGLGYNSNNTTTTLGSGVSSSSGNMKGLSSSSAAAKHQQRAGAALYADPQDMAFAQSSHSISMGLPEIQSSLDDQMFWGNMDSNLFDVFGAVSWETMTGPVGPMVSNPNNTWDMSAFTNSSGGGGGGGTDPLAGGRVL